MVIKSGVGQGFDPMFRRTLVALTLLTLAYPAVADAAVSPPQTVAVVSTPSASVLTWIPPTQGGADFYRVYGYASSGTRYLLMETTDTHALVGGGYAGYGVSAVKNGSESSVATPCGVDFRPGSNPPFAFPDQCD